MAKILVVDDERDLAEMLAAILELKGHQAKFCLDGYKAIEEAKSTHYDLIMMDIRLPEINGVETFIKIKEIDSEVKVVMMTGFAVEELLYEATKQGACGCIHKPFKPEKVLEMIERILKES